MTLAQPRSRVTYLPLLLHLWWTFLPFPISLPSNHLVVLASGKFEGEFPKAFCELGLRLTTRILPLLPTEAKDTRLSLAPRAYLGNAAQI